MRIVEQPISGSLAAYQEIPIHFETHTIFHVIGDDPQMAVLVETAVASPLIKDYDTHETDKPIHWATQWDISNWGLLFAEINGRHVGGCAIAHRTKGVNKLEGRDDLAVLWDLRVHPAYRGKGTGHALFQAAAAWATQRHCTELKIETQNINANACHFYKRQGCQLSAINRAAYPDYPDEIELIWSFPL